MKCLISGGCGFLGSHLAEKLVERGNKIVILDDFSSGSMDNVKGIANDGNVAVIEGSILDRNLVLDLTRDADTIFHLATHCLVKGLEDPQQMHEVNDIGTFNLLLAAKQHGSKFVFISTSEVYGPQETFPIKETNPLNPVSIYGQTKAVAEQYVRFFNKIYGVPAVIIRAFNTYGPRQREDGYAGVITSFAKKIKEGKPPVIFGDGKQTRDFSYVTDIVDGILLLSNYCMGGPNNREGCKQTFNLGSGHETSVLEIAKMIYEAMGVEPQEPAFAEPRINDIRRLQADAYWAGWLGYDPKVNLEDGIKLYVDWFMQKRDA